MPLSAGISSSPASGLKVSCWLVRKNRCLPGVSPFTWSMRAPLGSCCTGMRVPSRLNSTGPFTDLVNRNTIEPAGMGELGVRGTFQQPMYDAAPNSTMAGRMGLNLMKPPEPSSYAMKAAEVPGVAARPSDPLDQHDGLGRQTLLATRESQFFRGGGLHVQGLRRQPQQGRDDLAHPLAMGSDPGPFADEADICVDD